MRVLVTGASGFIGRRTLSPLRERGFEVHAVRSHWSAGEVAEADAWHEADLLDETEIRRVVERVRPTHLLHLAWYAVPGRFWTEEENFRWVGASMSLFSAFAASGGHRVVVSGTCAEYEWSEQTCSEATTPLVPSTPYGTCKRATFDLLRSYAALGSLSWGWGRVFHLYGPGEHPDRLVSSVIRTLLAGEAARCTDGRQVRDLTHVDDVAGGLVALLDTDVQGAVNVASGTGTAIRDVVQAIGEQVGRPGLVRLGALPTRSGEPLRLVADTRRLRKEVGYQTRFDLETGLRDTIDWWRTAGCANSRGDVGMTRSTST